MNVAIFISGRLTCYENNLLPILDYLDEFSHPHLFVSINGNRDEYHIEAESRLSKYLKDIKYEVYNVPEDFTSNLHPQTLKQHVDGKWVPYTNLSCFYNDKMAFNLATSYSKTHKIKYDIYCKFRPDITFHNINQLDFHILEKNTIYSNIPPCEIYFEGDRRNQRCVSDAFAYGDIHSMKTYTKTYNNILNLNNKLEGKYRINYELCLTESIFDMIYYGSYEIPGEQDYTKIYADRIKKYKIAYDSNDANKIISESKIKIKYFEAKYSLDPNRRNRDIIKH